MKNTLKKLPLKKQKIEPASWFIAFNYFSTYLQKLPVKKPKHVIFIDEMPCLDIRKSGFIAVLEFFWNQQLSKMNNILLLACGSASSWIKKT